MFDQKAFTLIEMLVVITIIAIFSAFIVIQVNDSINAGKDVKRKADIELLANAVVSYSTENYSKKPISLYSCSIGVDCSPEVEDSLKTYMPTLPDDPNDDASYLYQSDGNDCTISALLSDGTVYQYSCTEDFTTGTPTIGACGSAANTYNPGSTVFVGDLCSSGIPNPLEPVFPSVDGTTVSWECPGSYFGDSATCTAYRGKDGVCGTRENTSSTAYPDSDTEWPSGSSLCLAGTATPSELTFPNKGSYVNWSCSPLYAGNTDSCESYHAQNGACGSSSSGNFYLSSEITNPCGTGTVSTITTSLPAASYFKWSCNGIYGGTSPQCTANLKVNGACGSANGGVYATVPGASVRCANSTTPSNTTNWTWGCYGLNGGTSTTTTACSATYGINGVCGSSSGSCVSGTPTTSVMNGSYWNWNCTGAGAGTSASCSTPIPLNGGAHYATQCPGISGWFCYPPNDYCTLWSCGRSFSDGASGVDWAALNAVQAQGWTCSSMGFSSIYQCY